MSDDLEKIKREKVSLCLALRAAGIRQVIASYEGCGDSGNVGESYAFEDNPKYDPDNEGGEGPLLEVELPKQLQREVDSFVWGAAYLAHPGFEINEGGYGSVTIMTDEGGERVVIEHYDYCITEERADDVDY